METEGTFMTADLPLSAYLSEHGMGDPCVAHEEAGRCVFVFTDTAERTELVQDWFAGCSEKRFWDRVRGLRQELDLTLRNAGYELQRRAKRA